MPYPLLRDARDVAVFWMRDVLWRAFLATLGVLRRYLGKELLLAAIILALAWFRHDNEAFVDGLKESFVLLLIAAGVYGGGIFAWQLALAPLRLMRGLEKARLPETQPVRAADQRIAFKDRLLWLIEQGQRLVDPTAPAVGEGAFDGEADWASDAEEFLRAALGEGEAGAFRMRARAVDEDEYYMSQAVQHLYYLASKSDVSTIRPDFNPVEWRT